MRVNVYGEELTDRIELVEKQVDESGEVYTFYGLRLWLKFPNQDWWIHRKVAGELDDDSTAITIWAMSKEKLQLTLDRMSSVLQGTYDEYGIHPIEQPIEDWRNVRPGSSLHELGCPRSNPSMEAQDAPCECRRTG